jgi:hypothetical protein
LGHILIPGRFVVAEIADVFDIDREQVELTCLGFPAKSLRDRLGVTALDAAVLFLLA